MGVSLDSAQQTANTSAYVYCLYLRIKYEGKNSPLRQVGSEKRRKIFFLSVFVQDRVARPLVTLEPMSRFQLPSVKDAVDYKSMIRGYRTLLVMNSLLIPLRYLNHAGVTSPLSMQEYRGKETGRVESTRRGSGEREAT